MDNFWGAGIINKSFLNADQGYVYSSEVNTNSFMGSWFSPLFFSNPRRVKTTPMGSLPSGGNGLQDIGNGSPENPETPGTGAWTTWEFIIAANGNMSITAKAGTTGKYLDSPFGDDTQTTAITPGDGSNLNVTNPQELWVFGGRNQADAGFGTLGTAGVLVDNIEFVSAGGDFSVADFDIDDDVDGQDLLIWESSYGSGAGGDTDSDADSDGADFLTWQHEHTGVSSLAASVSIPEPTTALLLLLGLAGLAARRIRQGAIAQGASLVYLSSASIRLSLLLVGAMMLPSVSDARAATADDTISVNVGSTQFSWTFNKSKIQSGIFVDGQPWVVWQSGMEILQVTPTGHQENHVEDWDRWKDNLWIDLTVKNPQALTTIDSSGGKHKYQDLHAFGFDQRGLSRSRKLGGHDFFDLNVAWYPGKTSMPTLHVSPGDSIVTAKSYGPGETIVGTPLKAAAVLTVLASPPPADAFRPSPLRTGNERTNPKFHTTSQLIDLSESNSRLIQVPSRTLYNKEFTPNNSNFQDWCRPRLAGLLMGPEIISAGQVFHEGSHAAYNIENNGSGSTYGGHIAKLWGDVAIGALATWLPESVRRENAIKLVQHAIDVKGAVDAGLTLSHDGGITPAYGALITVGGALLGDHGRDMIAINNQVHGLSPDHFFSDYVQTVIISDIARKVGAVQYVDYRSPDATQNLSTESGTFPTPIEIGSVSGNCYLRFSKDYKWAIARSQKSLPHTRLKINNGPGASDTIYLVTSLKRFYDRNQNLASSNHFGIYGGDLTVTPDWTEGTPNTSSHFTLSGATDKEVGTIVFMQDGWGGNQYGELIRNTSDWTLSPREAYSQINAGAYLGLVVAIHALDVEDEYTSLFDNWLVQMMQIPGRAEILLDSTYPRSITEKGDAIDGVRANGLMLGALFRQEVLLPKGIESIAYNPSTTVGAVSDYPIAVDGKLWNEVESAQAVIPKTGPSPSSGNSKTNR